MNKNSILKILTTSTLLLTLALPSVRINAAANFNRLAGKDRYETSKAISSQFSSSNVAIVVTGENYPDALSAAPLAKKYDAPIILTNSKNLNSNAESELKRLKTKEVYIVGGNAAVSSTVENKIKSLGITVRRISGDNRYDTSVEVAKKVGLNNGIFVATGANYADALSIGPIAGQLQKPIVLVEKNSIRNSVAKLVEENNIEDTWIIGGENAVSTNVEKSFPYAARISGEDRYETNQALINIFGMGLDLSNAYVATGTNFPDALSGGALAAKNNNPIILTSENPNKYTIDTIKYNIIYHLTILGGENVISNRVISTLTSNLLPEFKYSKLDTNILSKGKELGFESLDNILIYNYEIYINVEDYRNEDGKLTDVGLFGLLDSNNQHIYEGIIESILPQKSGVIIDKIKNVNSYGIVDEYISIDGKEIYVFSAYSEENSSYIVNIDILK